MHALMRYCVCLRTVATDSLKKLWIHSSGQNVFPPSILMSQKQIIRKANSLSSLESYFVDEELIEVIGQKVQLDLLGIIYRGDCLNNNAFNPILNLKNLVMLKIHASRRTKFRPLPLPATDEFLVALVENLQQLLSLDVEAFQITDNGFVHLASLPKLRHLRMDFCPGVTDKFLFHFSGLEKLSVFGCNVRDEGVMELLGRAQAMEDLDVSATFITNETLMAAVKETKKRDNGIRLKIYTGATRATPKTFFRASPFLEIIDIK